MGKTFKRIRVLIVFFSESGNTKKMAEFIAEGVRREGDVKGEDFEDGSVEVELKHVDEVAIEDLLDAEAIIVGSPTYYGTMAWNLKKLLDESVKYHQKLDGKVGAAFASSGGIGGGNETTIMDILKAMLIHGMIIQGNPTGDHYGPVAVGSPDRRSKKNCIQLGERVVRLIRRLRIPDQS